MWVVDAADTTEDVRGKVPEQSRSQMEATVKSFDKSTDIDSAAQHTSSRTVIGDAKVVRQNRLARQIVGGNFLPPRFQLPFPR